MELSTDSISHIIDSLPKIVKHYNKGFNINSMDWFFALFPRLYFKAETCLWWTEVTILLLLYYDIVTLKCKTKKYTNLLYNDNISMDQHAHRYLLNCY